MIFDYSLAAAVTLGLLIYGSAEERRKNAGLRRRSVMSPVVPECAALSR